MERGGFRPSSAEILPSLNTRTQFYFLGGAGAEAAPPFRR